MDIAVKAELEPLETNELRAAILRDNPHLDGSSDVFAEYFETVLLPSTLNWLEEMKSEMINGCNPSEPPIGFMPR